MQIPHTIIVPTLDYQDKSYLSACAAWEDSEGTILDALSMPTPPVKPLPQYPYRVSVEPAGGIESHGTLRGAALVTDHGDVLAIHDLRPGSVLWLRDTTVHLPADDPRGAEWTDGRHWRRSEPSGGYCIELVWPDWAEALREFGVGRGTPAERYDEADTVGFSGWRVLL